MYVCIILCSTTLIDTSLRKTLLNRIHNARIVAQTRKTSSRRRHRIAHVLFVYNQDFENFRLCTIYMRFSI